MPQSAQPDMQPEPEGQYVPQELKLLQTVLEQSAVAGHSQSHFVVPQVLPQAFGLPQVTPAQEAAGQPGPQGLERQVGQALE